MDADALFNEADDVFNGDYLKYNTSEEPYDDTPLCLVHTVVGALGKAELMDFSHVALTRREMAALLVRNVAAIQAADNAIVAADACTIAYLRVTALRYGLVSSVWNLAQIHSRYNQCVAPTANTITVANMLADDANGLGQAEKQAAVAAINANLNLARRQVLNKVFVELVCTVAFMFRSRGHHYDASYIPRYDAIWKKTASYVHMPVVNWLHVARYALHAIPPIVLDEFWGHCTVDSKISEPLILRYTVKAAGTAIYGVLDVGVRDICAVLPNLKEVLKDSYDQLQEDIKKVEADRWNHSINAVYYGGNRTRLNEQNIAAIAAFVRGFLESLNEEHPLKKSPALERVANQAPITGAVLSRVTKQVIMSDKFADKLQIA